MRRSASLAHQPGANVFIVDTTYQVLNAVEAVNALGLSNNHLIILNESGGASTAYRKILDEKDWVQVIDVWLTIDTDRCRFTLLGPRLAESVIRWCARFQHFMRMRRANRIARQFVEVDNLFLGHYWKDYKGFMRHFSNVIEHNKLYILDDGTDVIDINRRRRALALVKEGVLAAEHEDKMYFRNIARRLRRKYWEMNLHEAKSITFFSVYDLNVRAGDFLAKNDYRHLKSLARATSSNGEIYFLGQCLAEDGYMDAELYLDYLRKVKAYFAGTDIKYVPHPRESDAMVERVNGLLGFSIRKFDVPVEYALLTGHALPKVLASFFCSALESCTYIFSGKIEVACFLIRPEHLKRARAEVSGIYEYFERKTGHGFSFIRL
jgi:hypothetical protein